MVRPQRFENQPARRIAQLRDDARRRSRIMGGSPIAPLKPAAKLPLFSPAESTEVAPLDSRRSLQRTSGPRSWFSRIWQRTLRTVNIHYAYELRRRHMQRRLLQEARDLRHLTAQHHASLAKDRNRIRLLERSLAGMMTSPQASQPGPGLSTFRGATGPRHITMVAPWYGALAWPDATKPTASDWWRWVPDHLARNLTERGYQVEMLTTCVRSPESNWWENELPIGTEFNDGVLVHRFGVNDDGEQRYRELAARLNAGEQLSAEEQVEMMHAGINSDALVQYARGRVAETAVVCIGSIHGLSYNLVHELDGHSVLIAGPMAEPEPGWETLRDMMASAGRLLFWSEDDRRRAIQRYGHELGPRLITATVLGPLLEDRGLDAASRSGSTEDRRLWDCIVDRLVLGVAQSCAS